ncbi:hypothetical protein FDP41_011024 [Naegleria fowleri]|uniref:PARG helical domain-containing protein n=1 Tax=Naegleria fowleri TaxID=5763 RepID=A0A6A5C5L1_NAEFO|nr:uncharacterized protein FDP41_011024 [Naegleria fowleri]KAF0983046.1 hypothetical protein FDP41_011024 [Naegleria fowleri]
MRKLADSSQTTTNKNNTIHQAPTSPPPFRVKPSKSSSSSSEQHHAATPSQYHKSSTPPTKSNYSSKKKVIEGWNSNHVKLPCHENNVYFENNRQLSKWYLIKTLLQQKIRNVNDLIQVIRSINSSWTFNSSTFSSLQTLFEDVYNESEKERFFNKTLPCIQSLALELPNLFDKSSIPLLKQQSDAIVHLSRKQICCLLAHALFCTFPRRNQTSNPSDEYYSYPSINFITLFKKSPLTKRLIFKKMPNSRSNSTKDSIFDDQSNTTTSMTTTTSMNHTSSRMITPSNLVNEDEDSFHMPSLSPENQHEGSFMIDDPTAPSSALLTSTETATTTESSTTTATILSNTTTTNTTNTTNTTTTTTTLSSMKTEIRAMVDSTNNTTTMISSNNNHAMLDDGRGWNRV